MFCCQVSALHPCPPYELPIALSTLLQDPAHGFQAQRLLVQIELCEQLLQQFCKTCGHKRGVDEPPPNPSHLQYTAFREHMRQLFEVLPGLSARSHMQGCGMPSQPVRPPMYPGPFHTCAPRAPQTSTALAVAPTATSLEDLWALDQPQASEESPCSHATISPIQQGAPVAVSRSKLPDPPSHGSGIAATSLACGQTSIKGPEHQKQGSAPAFHAGVLSEMHSSGSVASAASRTSECSSGQQHLHARFHHGALTAGGSVTHDLGARGAGGSGQAAQQMEYAQEQRLARRQRSSSADSQASDGAQALYKVLIDVPAEFAAPGGYLGSSQSASQSELQSSTYTSEDAEQSEQHGKQSRDTMRSITEQRAVVGRSILAPPARLTNTSESDPGPHGSNMHPYVQAAQAQLHSSEHHSRTLSEDTLLTDSTPVLGTPGMPDIAMAHARMAAGRHAPREPSGFRKQDLSQCMQLSQPNLAVVKPADLIPVNLFPLPRLPAGAKATLPSSQ